MIFKEIADELFADSAVVYELCNSSTSPRYVYYANTGGNVTRFTVYNSEDGGLDYLPTKISFMDAMDEVKAIYSGLDEAEHFRIPNDVEWEMIITWEMECNSSCWNLEPLKG